MDYSVTDDSWLVCDDSVISVTELVVSFSLQFVTIVALPPTVFTDQQVRLIWYNVLSSSGVFVGDVLFWRDNICGFRRFEIV